MQRRFGTLAGGPPLIVEITNYYARPGQADSVLQQRRHATAIRVSLGLSAGRIFRKIEGAGPDVRWECEFPTREEYEADMSARAASAEFGVNRQRMHELLDRFERHLQQSVD